MRESGLDYVLSFLGNAEGIFTSAHVGGQEQIACLIPDP
jgi:hypothetical protein